MLDRAEYDKFRVAPTDPATLRCREVERILKKLTASAGGRLKLEKFAESNEERPIYLATIGTGPKRILMWSQMHGDEPTHTSVVLDLISHLLQEPAKPQAAELLKNCTLYIIPMLNPDGAEAVSRFNAQGIDVNRDALRMATPEARALRKAVDTIKPEFGFNLHNQHPRTSVGNPPRPATVSVLAPAPNPKRTETPAMRRGKHMCATFVEAVRPYAGRMISRYDDSYEPRAFGDTIQSLGTATMLVEAGGWPDADPEPLTRLHFHGLLNTLHAIATGEFEKSNVDSYELLPRSNSRQLLDCLVMGGQLLDSTVGKPFRSDLAIEQSHGQFLLVTPKRDGKIVDIGDLSTMAAKMTIDANGQVVTPGRITVLENWKPGTPLKNAQVDALLAAGTTTVIGLVDLASRGELEAIDDVKDLPLNWGFVATLEKAQALNRGEFLERLAIAAHQGVLAAVGGRADEEVWSDLSQFGLPLIQRSQLPSKSDTNASYSQVAQQAGTLAGLLGLENRRGELNRGRLADLIFLRAGNDFDATKRVDWKQLERVMVAGETVWENGKRAAATPGVPVRRSSK